MFSIARSTALRASRTQLRSSTATTVPHISALARLLSSLAVLEQRDGKLNVSSLAAVTAAQKLGGSVTGIVAGSGIKAVAEEAAKVKGLDNIIFVENGAYDKVCILRNLLISIFCFSSICESQEMPPVKI
jgi:electron transfer flavoprotein alpha subunit